MLKDLLFRGVRFIARPLMGKGYWSAPIFRPIAMWFRKASMPEYVMVDGHRLYLNPKDTGFSSLSFNLTVHGFHEKMETEIMRRYIRPGMKVLDVGANIGYFTVMMSTLVGEKGRVTAFEPDSTNYALLTRTVAGLSYRNVKVIKGAVWDATGSLDLYVSDDNPGDHQTFRTEEARTHYAVPSIALDDYLNGEPVDFIKMDIQGAEGRALDGMRKLLERHPPGAILMEFWPSMLAKAGTDPQELFDRLVGLGYRINRIDDDAMETRPVTFGEIVAQCDLDWKFVNLICLRGEAGE